MNEIPPIFDVLIVGAGPGGIAAAVVAAEAGRTVGLIDDAPFAGGQIWRNRGEKTKSRQARVWMSRLESVVDAGSVTWLRQSRVVAARCHHEDPDAGSEVLRRAGVSSPPTLLCETPHGPRTLGWKSLILAPGSRELFLPFPGWTTPGVFGAGAIQALMKQGLPVRGKRVIVAGSGPLLLAVADLLRSRGAIVPLLLEQATAAKINRFAMSLVRSPSKLFAGVVLRTRLLGSRYATDSYPLRVSSQPSGLRVDFRNGRRNEVADCDYLACGFNLIPNNELPQLLGCKLTGNGFVQVDHQLRSTVPNIFAIGEITGIGGVEKAIIEGQLAGHVVAGNENAANKLSSAHASVLNFTGRLESAFALRRELFKLAEPDTIVCRCEDVPLSVVSASINARDAKLQTRCGMGPCQGRICGPILQKLLGTESPQIRPPIFAATIGTLAAASNEMPNHMASRPLVPSPGTPGCSDRGHR